MEQPMTTDWFNYLKVRPYQRITAYWLNSLVDAVNLAYDIAYTKFASGITKADLQTLDVDVVPLIDNTFDLGKPSKRWKTVYTSGVLADAVSAGLLRGATLVGNSASFKSIDSDEAKVIALEVDGVAKVNTLDAQNDIFVQGKRVIKDDDPIHIYDFFDTAQQQMTTSILNALQQTPVVRLTVDDQGRLYAVVDAFQDQAYDLLNQIDQHVQQVYHAVSGPLGVIVVKPVDSAGRVKVDTTPYFDVKYVTKSVTADENTNGFELVLMKGGRYIVNVYVESDRTTDVYVDVSLDGVNWRNLDNFTIFSNSPEMRAYSNVAYPFVRVRVPQANISVTADIVAAR